MRMWVLKNVKGFKRWAVSGLTALLVLALAGSSFADSWKDGLETSTGINPLPPPAHIGVSVSQAIGSVQESVNKKPGNPDWASKLTAAEKEKLRDEIMANAVLPVRGDEVFFANPVVGASSSIGVGGTTPNSGGLNVLPFTGGVAGNVGNADAGALPPGPAAGTNTTVGIGVEGDLDVFTGFGSQTDPGVVSVGGGAGLEVEIL